MLVTEFSTGIVEAPERFAMFEEITAESHIRTRLRSNDKDDFRAQMHFLDLGELQVSALTFPHLEITRTAKAIRQSDPEVYMISYMPASEGSFSQAGRDATFQAGDLTVLDSSHPFDADRRTLQGGWSQLIVQLPHKLLPLPEKTVQSLLAVPISGRNGMGGVFARWLTDLHTRDADEFDSADIPTLASVTLDLLASVIARCLDAEAALSPAARRNALRAQISTFVEQHLADPALTPQVLADAHHISLRHLQQLLAADGTSPAAWIRHRRLERCRLDLANPSLDNRPIHAIAARWGLSDPMHFSRMFRAAYGISPRDYRNLPHAACANRQHPCAQ